MSFRIRTNKPEIKQEIKTDIKQDIKQDIKYSKESIIIYDQQTGKWKFIKK